MSQSSVTSQSTWRSKIKAMGPGILMASAAVGGSHIVSSTQAGGKYGWALLGLVILANLFKYPFFRFGALIQYPTGKPVVAASAAYIAQFVGMYESVLGTWSRYLITFIAFLCIFGTVITVIDGYSRVNEISLRLLFNKKESSATPLNVWMTLTSIIGLIIIIFFQGQVGTMLRFAMIGSFLTTPFFALLNYVLVTKAKKDFPMWLKVLAIAGLIFLFGFAIFFIWAMLIGKAGV